MEDDMDVSQLEAGNEEEEVEEDLVSRGSSYSSSGSLLQDHKALFCSERYLLSNLLPQGKHRKVVQWRMKERMKTVSVLIALCLNIGVDPPDVIKTSPSARLEGWIDPHAQPPTKALDSIGKSIQSQYERLQPRARYKLCPDPTSDEVKKTCTSLRRNAKDERILFHYNGHGVPKPTQNGEIWVFNKTFTQYIPLSLYDLQSWIGTPSIYVFDCSNAGTIVQWFNKFDQDCEKSRKKTATGGPPAAIPSTTKAMRDYILLASCSSTEVLPTNPDLPADIFTACLTTPIKIALKWFCTQTIVSGINPDLIDKIPGRLTDRRTPLGELNWIFTAVTDTIAWNVLPQELFQKLFRQDLLVANLFRNFLLAERIMRTCKCTPISHPKLPSTYNHPMWQAWDLAVDHNLVQLPQLISNPNYEYEHSSFFTEQLTAFEVCLEFATEDKLVPEQLPIVLQVLLSQQHRLRALELLGRFLDLGPWAVNQALSVGIFPYVLKLLQCPAVELRRILVFIWAKILALDQSCQLDLVKDNGQHYFVNVLTNAKIPAEQRQQAAFVLSVICNNCRPGQSACLNAKLLQICLANLSNSNAMLRRWVVLALAKFWENHEEGKKLASKESAHEKLCGLLTDPVPEVRAAAVYALGTYIGRSGNTAVNREQRTVDELNLGLTFAVVTADGSPLVRKELVIALSALVSTYEDKFKFIEKYIIKQEIVESRQRAKKTGLNSDTETTITNDGAEPVPQDPEENSIYEYLWKLVCSLANDPFPLIAQMAVGIIKRIRDRSMEELKLPNPPPVTPPRPANTEIEITKAHTKSSSFTSLGSLFRPVTPPLHPSLPHPVIPVLSNEQLHVDSHRSILYEWSSQQFSYPLLPFLRSRDRYATTSQQTGKNKRGYFYNRSYQEDVDPQQLERWRKYDDVRESARSLSWDKVYVSKMENEIAILENKHQMVSQMQFHPYENLLVVSDEHDGVAVWNWDKVQMVSHFCNNNPAGTRITSLNLLNENDSALIAVGADDGVVRIWSGLSKSEPLNLVSSWRIINYQGDHTNGAMLVLDWQQKNDSVIASGNLGALKVWDINRELCVQDIQIANSCVMSLTSDKHESGKMLVAGCWDGSLRIYDKRSNSKFGPLATLQEHKGYILNVSIPVSLGNQIVSSSVQGEIKFWDLRNPKTSLKTYIERKADQPLMTSFSIHNYAPVMAMGQDQKIVVMNFNGEMISTIRYHDGFLGQRIGPISSLCFHPFKNMLAAGATDSIVSIYSADLKSRENNEKL